MKLPGLFKDARRRHAHNLRTLLTSPLPELSGALGDLGTLLPLMIALAQQGSISLSSTLVFSGLFNILTGGIFGIPLPVQPMKAIAAEAISRGVGREQVLAAGGWVAVAVGTLAATGGLRWLGRVVPVPVVKGIQMGAGLQLVGFARGRAEGEGAVWLFAGLCAVLVGVFVMGMKGRAVPFALVMFVAGVVWAVSETRPEDRPGWKPWVPAVGLPAWFGGRAGEWGTVAGMALGQLPLTTLNSVVAVSALASDLMPDFPVSVTSLGFSVAGMNLVGCWFGAMPVCHGAGGLAAQWRFGARSGASVVVLGLMKLILGLVFGDSLIGVIDRFPGAVLGVMVLGAGLELTRVAVGVNEDAMDLWEDDGEEEGGDGAVVLRRKKRTLDEEERAERWLVMLVTMAGIVSFRNDAVGFAGGMLCYWFYRLAAWWERRRGQGDLHI
ncbi:hypothetical protein CONLIGDRAFT_139797 [Coniochaeta ligniaria NRRL 30616]|uniref:Sulfate transporter n=1 Tax=Coniochaeta ligniaria NRRL 30616 TaxID=1408157 RepID=A0A1J7I8J3_9PEZI|nr:hypothetical protein CONLIGDRAFT_139797 [Coniochaeta ligniaria NRRL 30616]